MDKRMLRYFAVVARRRLTAQMEARLDAALAGDEGGRLEKALAAKGRERLVADAAYVWFNRFCALWFLEANRYASVRVLGALPGHFLPEILEEAMAGRVWEGIDAGRRTRVLEALAEDKNAENLEAAYALLLEGACHYWREAMPFLFAPAGDWTAPLIPDNLLGRGSVVSLTWRSLTAAQCTEVEVFGWLYQFYVSEEKSGIFAALRSVAKIAPEKAAAATQLFTPDYIVRYLVDNSLGRLWMLNRPHSRLAERLLHYVAPARAEAAFARVAAPEDLRICDPACGSGHILNYAFDVLYAIYEEEGYAPAVIPAKILRHNLYGMDLCGRAGQLAALALAMKGRAREEGFFGAAVVPNIGVWENVAFAEGELARYFEAMGREDLLTDELRATLEAFGEVELYGSLLHCEAAAVDGVAAALAKAAAPADGSLRETHGKVLRVLRQAVYLRPNYHVVLTNPPYMGSPRMHEALSEYAKKYYPTSRMDSYAMFIEQGIGLVREKGLVAMVTMQNWMFLSRYEKLRKRLLNELTFLSVAHLGTHAFDAIGGAGVAAVSFVLKKSYEKGYRGDYLRLVEESSGGEKNRMLLAIARDATHPSLYRVSADELAKVPDSPLNVAG